MDVSLLSAKVEIMIALIFLLSHKKISQIHSDLVAK